MKKYKILFIVVVVLIFCSCIKHKSLYQREKVNSENYSDYCYPFSEEIKGINAEILIQTKEDIDWKQVEISIPPLKYNKAWLFTLTQDDCKQAAYSCTWYGTAISFHDVNTNAVKNVDSIIMHFAFSQDSILRHLSGRECKFLVEPNGNKIYISAAQEYAPIQIMTAQDQTVRLFPFQVQNDLKKQ